MGEGRAADPGGAIAWTSGRRSESGGGLLVGLRREHVETGHGIGLRELLGGAKGAPVGIEGGEQGTGRKVGSEGVGEPQDRRELRAVQARTEDPDWNVLAASGNGLDGFVSRLPEITLQLDHVAGEVIGIALQVPAKGVRGALVGAGRAPKAKVDAPRIERIEGAELLRDDERGVVREHDAARAHPDRGRPARDVADDDGGRRARDPGDVVMLGDPVAAVPETFRAAGEIERIAHGPRGTATLGDGREVEYGERGHGACMGKVGELGSA